MQPQFCPDNLVPANYAAVSCDSQGFIVISSDDRSDFSNIDYLYAWPNAWDQINDEIMLDKIVFGGGIWTSIDLFPNLTASKYYFYELADREVIRTLEYIKKNGLKQNYWVYKLLDG
ncbi:MAG: hypothetical protein O7C59_05775 [Rickettsia endosymbiont of Ixodes persulcatus]|nr:hypothetical protein [Rickettsia endosymbiont of Ixodes persulcatus]